MSVALGSHVVVPAYETGQRLNVFDVPRLGRFGNRHVDDPGLREYLDRVLPSISESVWRKFYRCDIQQRHSVLAVMRGYEKGWQMCPWSSDQFMEMLLANHGRRYPQVWISTFVAMLLPQHVKVLPFVAEWLESFTVHSGPLYLTVVIRGTAQSITMRYEDWVLWAPDLREERVLAYRTHPEGVCACCQQPAFWKVPRGPRGCAARTLRAVAPRLFRKEWAEITLRLSRSRTSRFEEMLSYDWFNVALFEVCFVDLDCLSCSCGGCSMKDLRAGVMCPVDQEYVDFELAGPDSPRGHAQPLVDVHREARRQDPFEVRAREARRQHRESQ